MGIERVIISVIMVCSLISMASAIAGTSTYYTPPYVPSSCYGFVNQGTLIAAANANLFNKRAACGQFYRVRCTGSTSSVAGCRGGVVRVKIVDLCPGCGPGQIDLSKEAFAVIANPDAGRIRIDYVRD